MQAADSRNRFLTHRGVVCGDSRPVPARGSTASASELETVRLVVEDTIGGGAWVCVGRRAGRVGTGWGPGVS